MAYRAMGQITAAECLKKFADDIRFAGGASNERMADAIDVILSFVDDLHDEIRRRDEAAGRITGDGYRAAVSTPDRTPPQGGSGTAQAGRIP